MTQFEFVSLVLSGVAVLVSLVVWNGQRKLQREANELQRVTADLSRKQLQLIKEQEASKHQAKLALALVPDGRGYKLVLSNNGPADALAVDLRPIGSTAADSFLVESELKDKLPHKRLRSSEQLRFIAAVTPDTPAVQEFHVTWQNADGSTAMEHFAVSL